MLHIAFHGNLAFLVHPLFIGKSSKNDNIFFFCFILVVESAMYSLENCNQPDTEDDVTYENHDEEAVAMLEEFPSGVCQVYTIKYSFSMN